MKWRRVISSSSISWSVVIVGLFRKRGLDYPHLHMPRFRNNIWDCGWTSNSPRCHPIFVLCPMLPLRKCTAFYDFIGKIVGTYGVPMRFQFSLLMYLSFIVEITIIFYIESSPEKIHHLCCYHRNFSFTSVNNLECFNWTFYSNFCLSTAEDIAYNLILPHTSKDWTPNHQQIIVLATTWNVEV